MNMNNWVDLENYVEELIRIDNPKRPPNSGGTKGEEDIIGETLIVQCKYTDNKNMSILEKDLDRLLLGAEQLDKFPIFITGNSKHTILSIPINFHSYEVIKNILLLIHVLISSVNLRLNVSFIKDFNIYRKAENIYNKLEKTSRVLINTIKTNIDRCKIKLSSKYDDLTMYNLFEEGEENAPK